MKTVQVKLRRVTHETVIVKVEIPDDEPEYRAVNRAMNKGYERNLNWKVEDQEVVDGWVAEEHELEEDD